MIKENISIDSSQIKVFERFFDLIAKDGLINLSAKEIRHFLKDTKSVTIQSVNIKKATKENIEKSGILSDELQKSRKSIINITADASITLADIDTIVGTISEFHKCECVFSTLYDEKQEGFRIDTFLAKM